MRSLLMLSQAYYVAWKGEDVVQERDGWLGCRGQGGAAASALETHSSGKSLIPKGNPLFQREIPDSIPYSPLGCAVFASAAATCAGPRAHAPPRRSSDSMGRRWGSERAAIETRSPKTGGVLPARQRLGRVCQAGSARRAGQAGHAGPGEAASSALAIYRGLGDRSGEAYALAAGPVCTGFWLLACPAKAFASRVIPRARRSTFASPSRARVVASTQRSTEQGSELSPSQRLEANLAPQAILRTQQALECPRSRSLGIDLLCLHP